ncbi:lipopolysaccharide biosynthesis protein [Sporolactobacillus shoreicorticis]|uniref:Lipopolysaccharide biosynthesis protein n=1 Tax=Sporolactobacillus shoreicorticis TaxID=1923877 RepID=A0ABW5S4A2_9BACL|nr:lipopolysaccharide biosynthesis protein [Sporolactobacillus shoreicorticis]MCO7127548.1 lipopolysaccharide biosynthesis protein [Sporolactobacillus shoreicorticis]
MAEAAYETVENVMNKLIKKLIGFSMGPVIGALISFMTIPLTTYYINPAEYGKASMFLLFQTIVGTFLFLGVDQAYTREYHGASDKTKLLQHALLLPLGLALLVLFAALLHPRPLSQLLFGRPDEALPTILFGVMTLFMVLERFLMLSVRMREKAFEYSLLAIMAKSAVFLLTLFFIFFIRRDFLTVVYATVFGQITGDAWLFWRYRRMLNPKGFSMDRVLLKTLVTFGLPIVIATSLSSLLGGLDRLALRLWSTFNQIGIFSATLKVAAVLSVFQSGFTSFWVPTAYRWYSENRPVTYFKIVSDTVLLAMSLLAAGIFLFKGIIVFLLSAHYSSAQYLVCFLCMQPLIYTVSETTCLGIVFSKKSYLNIWVGLCALIPAVILDILLVPPFGAKGAAIATAVAFLFFFAARTFFSGKHWVCLPVTKHYIVFLILFAAAFINLMDVPWLTIANIFSLLLILIVQRSTIRVLWVFWKKTRTNRR